MNQGSVDATNVEVTDYIPANLELADTNWTLRGTNAVRTIANLPAGESVTLGLSLRVKTDATAGDTINWAEISRADGGTDIDSTPDANNDNDCHGGLGRDEVDPNSDDRLDGVGDTNNNGTCEAGEDEDDHDPALVSIEIPTITPSIAIDKTDGANSQDEDGSTGNDSQTVDRGDSAVFKITVTNDGTEDLDTIVLTDSQAQNCAGSVTLPSTFPSTWSSFTTTATGNVLKPGESFSYECIKTNTTSNYTNSATVTAA